MEVVEHRQKGSYVNTAEKYHISYIEQGSKLLFLMTTCVIRPIRYLRYVEGDSFPPPLI
jgi:hypothetical protein